MGKVDNKSHERHDTRERISLCLEGLGVLSCVTVLPSALFMTRMLREPVIEMQQAKAAANTVTMQQTAPTTEANVDQQIKSILRVQDFLDRIKEKVDTDISKNRRFTELSCQDFQTLQNINKIVQDPQAVFGEYTDCNTLRQFIDNAEPVIDGIMLQLFRQREQQNADLSINPAKKCQLIDRFRKTQTTEDTLER